MTSSEQEQNSSSGQRIVYPDELSLKEFLLGLVDILRWLKSHWWQLALCILIGAGAYTYRQLSKEPQYQATLTFILADDHSNGMGGLGSVLGQFGLPSSSGKYNIDKLLEIAKSRRIGAKALLSEVQINGKKGLLGNFYIEVYELDKKWSKNRPEMEGFRFKNNDSDSFSTEENRAINSILGLLVGTKGNRSNALLQMDYGSTDYVMSYDVTNLHQELAIETAKQMYDHLKEFYIFQASEKAQSSYDLVRQKRDSIAKSYQSIEYQIAKLKDQSASTFAYSSSVQLANLSTQSVGLKLALAEVEKNLSIAELSLKSNTPMIQKIDDPVGPLAPIPVSILKCILIGGIIGAAIYMIGLFLVTVIKMV